MPSDSSLHWKDVLIQALEESDREKLRQLVPKAEASPAWWSQGPERRVTVGE
jgi:hypothetical protein